VSTSIFVPGKKSVSTGLLMDVTEKVVECRGAYLAVWRDMVATDEREVRYE
jgi:hypothetical protein